MTRRHRIIPTLYGGILYRSRTEARWAVFFDALEVPFEYEPQGYHLGPLNYLPDFWLRTWRLYVEVKGTDPTEDEIAKAKMLAAATQKKVLVVIGDPGQRRGILFPPGTVDAPGIPDAFPAVCRHCRVRALSYRYGEHGHGTIPLDAFCEAPDRCGDHFTAFGSELDSAIDAARNHRFDRKRRA